jgi:hypothetical protein
MTHEHNEKQEYSTTHIGRPGRPDALVRFYSEAFSQGNEFVTSSLQLVNDIWQKLMPINDSSEMEADGKGWTYTVVSEDG